MLMDKERDLVYATPTVIGIDMRAMKESLWRTILGNPEDRKVSQ